MMRPHALAVALLLAGITSPLGSAASARSPAQIQYGCDDVVVIGRFQNDRDLYEPVATNGVQGYGWLRANVNVMNLLRGDRPRFPIVVRYIGHTWYMEHHDFLLVLYREPGAETFSMRSVRYLERTDDVELASRCVEAFPEDES